MSFREEVEAIGEAKGKAIGKAEGKAETALAMLRRGLDVALIMDVTGLSIEVIRELQKEAVPELS